MARDWAWELNEHAYGPDHFFLAEVALPKRVHLAELVHDLAPVGFVHDEVTERQPHCSTQVVYLDEHTHELVLASQTSGQPQNIWVYTQIELCDHRITIERGYGSQLRQAETELLVRLVTSDHVTFVLWRIEASGQGYEVQPVASGTTNASLLEYLQID